MGICSTSYHLCNSSSAVGRGVRPTATLTWPCTGSRSAGPHMLTRDSISMCESAGQGRLVPDPLVRPYCWAFCRCDKPSHLADVVYKVHGEPFGRHQRFRSALGPESLLADKARHVAAKDTGNDDLGLIWLGRSRIQNTRRHGGRSIERGFARMPSPSCTVRCGAEFRRGSGSLTQMVHGPGCCG
jgi:hypothetical protein